MAVARDDVTVGIKTFLRPGRLDGCLNGIWRVGLKKVVVADDGPDESANRKVYDKYSDRLDLDVVRLPYDTGLSRGRNEIVKRVATPYVLMLDDDQELCSQIEPMLEFLEAHEVFGGVSPTWVEHGSAKCLATNLQVSARYIVKDCAPPYDTFDWNGWTFIAFDHIPNSTLYRTECVREVPWDAEHKIGREHVDFFLTHKRKGRWKFAVCPDLFLRHRPGGGQEYEQGHRDNARKLIESVEHLRSKWDVRGVVEGRKFIEPERGWAGGLLTRLVSERVLLTPIYYLQRRNLAFQMVKQDLRRRFGAG